MSSSSSFSGWYRACSEYTGAVLDKLPIESNEPVTIYTKNFGKSKYREVAIAAFGVSGI